MIAALAGIFAAENVAIVMAVLHFARKGVITVKRPPRPPAPKAPQP